MKRHVFVRLLPEAGYSSKMVGELDKCLCCTRDPAQGWEGTYAKAMTLMGVRRGRSSPCIFYYPVKDIKCTGHGDDFFSEGLPDARTWFERSLLAKFERCKEGWRSRETRFESQTV